MNVSARVPIVLVSVALYALPGVVTACDLNAWSSEVDTNSRLSADTDARNTSLCGLRVDLDNTDDAYVVDSTAGMAGPVTSASVRVYVFADNVSFVGSDAITLLSGYDGGPQPVFELALLEQSGSRKLLLKAYTDALTPVSNMGQEIPLHDGWRSIELHWQAASAPGANDGRLSLRLDGILTPSVSQVLALDNDTRVLASTHLGAVANNTVNVGGYIDFDDYSRRELGAAPMLDKYCNGTNVSIENMTFRKGDWYCVAGTAFFADRRTRVDPRGLLTVISDSVAFGDGFGVANGGFLRVEPLPSP